MEIRLNDEQTAQGLDKVSRYNWTMRNVPGQFLMIPKTDLEVDAAYQRNRINQRRVDALTRTWDWIACGCLVVALRDDNKWFVVDGQHRKLAADQRSDIQELPCLVFETGTRREEAVSFLAINQGRVGVATARFTTQSVDPFDVLHLEPTQARGWDQGKLLSEKQRSLLTKQGINPDQVSFTQGKQLIAEIFRRWDGKLCSFKQAKVLRKYGFGTDVSFADASATIDQLARNGWRRTPVVADGNPALN